MSDDNRPSLTALRAALAGAEARPWDRTTARTISNDEYDIARCEGAGDARAVVEVVNASEVLIEIAEAVIAFAAEFKDAPGWTPVFETEGRLAAALAKVKP